MITCPHCGTTSADASARFCPSCGGNLSQPAQAAPRAGGQDQAEMVLFDGHPALVPSLGALLLSIITVGLALIVLWLRARTSHYRVTNHRVVVEDGIFSKHMEQVDLYRVVDYQVERPFGQRLMGTGNLVLKTLDKTTPTVRLHGLRTDVRALYEGVRAAAEEHRRLRGVRVVDYE